MIIYAFFRSRFLDLIVGTLFIAVVVFAVIRVRVRLASSTSFVVFLVIFVVLTIELFLLLLETINATRFSFEATAARLVVLVGLVLVGTAASFSCTNIAHYYDV